MSELIQKNDNRMTIRLKLLTGASALALAVYVSSTASVHAEGADHPQLWIELGGQLSGLSDGQGTFSPVFPNSPARPSIFSPSQKFDGPPRFSIDEEGKLSFQPDGSDWIFSASVRYGRSSRNRHVHQQTQPQSFTKYYYNSYASYAGQPPGRHKHKNVRIPQNAKFADTLAQNSERHFVLDFQAGKDVGLGMFGGRDGSSVVSLGVRFAQFTSKSNIALKSDPDWQFYYKYNANAPNYGFTGTKFVLGSTYHANQASLRATRSFHGIGPSISWSASAPFAGGLQDGELTFDWGINAALLFGRQRAKVHHQTTGRYHPAKYQGHAYITSTNRPADQQRSRSVTVPNVGGFAGLSFSYSDAKLSLGYRADFFLNAVDGGIEARKSENRGFFGPFASISIGLGD